MSSCLVLGVRLYLVVFSCVRIFYPLAPDGCFFCFFLPSKWVACTLCSYGALLSGFTLHVGV